MSNNVKKTKLVLLIVLLVLLTGGGTSVPERNNLYDWWRLRNYRPPQSVVQLATQDTMTSYARHLLYVNHPMLLTGAAFNTPCPNNGGEKTIVLGCYHSGESGIFLLNVNDPLLDGVEQVTAAHEMLHAAYERLSGPARSKLNTMLLDYYNHDLTDQRIKDTIGAYRQSEPNDVVNEMHSVFGTEIAQLPPDLEAYYKKYFTDRAAIAADASQYQAEFTSRQTTVTADDAKLASLKNQIDTLTLDLKSKLTAIQSAQSTLTGERSSGSIDAYNAGVPAYNQAVDTYNSEADQLQSLVSQYNQLVAARNAVAVEEDHLASELSTSATPIE